MSLEHQLQCWYVLFLQSQNILFCASAGGMWTNKRTAKNMKRAGYKKGFPDIFIYEPRGGYHGMAVELKVKGGKVGKDQKHWRDELLKRGYYAVIMPTNLEYRKSQEWIERETLSYLAISKQIPSIVSHWSGVGNPATP